MHELRPVYFCYPSVFSLTFVNHWVRTHGLPLSGIVLSTAAGFAKGKPLPFWKVAMRTISESGWRYAWYELSFTTLALLLVMPAALLCRLGILRRRLLSFEEIAAQCGAALFESPDFSSAETLEFLRRQQANLGISAFNNQIFRSPTIAFFQQGAGLYNFHPALLPDFRGSDPIVPALLARQTEIGVTLHVVDPNIDTGDILAQRRIPVAQDDSAFTLNHKAWVTAARMLEELLPQLPNETLPTIKQSDLPRRFGYFSFPTGAEVRRLHQTGRKLYSLNALLRSIGFPDS